MQHTVTLTHHSLWFVQWTTIHLMLQAWASTCIVQSSLSNYSLRETTWESVTEHTACVVWLRQAPWMPLVAIAGLIMGPPFDHLHCLALYWHGGIDGLDVLHVSTRHRSHSGKKKEKNNWTQLPQKELVSLNDWRMLAELNSSWHFKKHSKNFRGIQCKDLKHLTET